MTFPVSALSRVASVEPLSATGLGRAGVSGTFEGVLKSAIENIDKFRAEAEVKVGKFLAGEGEELHDVILATQRAELSFDMFQSVRNKVVQSYQEIMRMQM